MKIQRWKERQYIFLLLLLIFVIATFGCTVRLIAPYDQKIDDGITKLQEMTTEFLTKVASQGGSKPEDYNHHINFYDNAQVKLSGIRLRAESMPQNRKTYDQLEYLKGEFEKLKSQDKNNGMTPGFALSEANIFDRLFRAILILEIAKKDIPS